MSYPESHLTKTIQKPQIPTFRVRSPLSLLDKIKIGDCDYQPNSKESSNSENQVILTNRSTILGACCTDRGKENEVSVFDFFGNTMKSSAIIKVEE